MPDAVEEKESKEADATEEQGPTSIKVRIETTLIQNPEVAMVQTVELPFEKDDDSSPAKAIKRYRETLMERIGEANDADDDVGWMKIGSELYNLDAIARFKVDISND
jgi:hypothetical protein